MPYLDTVSAGIAQGSIIQSSHITTLYNTLSGTGSLGISVVGDSVFSGQLTIGSIGSTIVTGSTSTDLFRITQTGTGNALVVEDSANPDATPFVIDNSGNVLIGTTSSAGIVTMKGTGAVGLALDTDNSSNIQSTRLFFKNSGSNKDVSLRALNGGFIVGLNASASWTSGTSSIYISQSGDIGIGLGFTPGTRGAVLQVSGNISIESGFAYKQDNSTVIYIAKGSDSFYANTIGGADAGTFGSYRQTAFGNSAGSGNTGSYQTVFGYQAGQYNSGSTQIAIGPFAGALNSGSDQIALGSLAGYGNKAGGQIAIGSGTGQYNSGSSQIAIGTNAGQYNSGSYQIAIGNGAGQYNSGNYNVSVGLSAGQRVNTSFNTAIGVEAGYYNSGSNTTTVGYNAGYYNSGSSVTAVGWRAGYFNSGSYTTMIGLQAGYINSGSNQTAVGYSAGAYNTGSNQTAMGYEAGFSNSEINQTAVGFQAGYDNSGSQQTALGSLAGQYNTGSNQTAVGRQAGYSNSAVNQTAVGMQAGYDNSGTNQTAIGAAAGYFNIGIEQTAVGSSAGYANTGSSQTVVGVSAGAYNSGSNQTAIGLQAGQYNTGSDQTAVGWRAGYFNSGLYTIAVGSLAGAYNNSSNQTVVGYQAGYLNIGSSQTAMGYSAGSRNTGVNQTAIGENAGYANTAQNQTAIGLQAGQYNTGSNQTVVGVQAGQYNTGSNQTAVGHSAGYFNSGSNQTAVGMQAGAYNSGSDNTNIGYNAGYFVAGTSGTLNSQSAQSVFLGSSTTAGGANRTNQIVIGYGATGLGNNTAVLGNSSIAHTILRGNVGIGTSITESAKYLLTVSGSTSTDLVHITQTGAGNAFRIDDSTGDTSPFVIDNNGKVGIGTIAPTASLHVYQSDPATAGYSNIAVQADAGVGINIISDMYAISESVVTFGRRYSGQEAFLAYSIMATASNSSDYQSSTGQFSSQPTLLELGNGRISFKFNSTNAVRPKGTKTPMTTSLNMDSAGRWGIGISSSIAAMLHISSSAGSGYGTEYPLIVGNGSSNSQFSITNTGDVGIGITTPTSAKLHVVSTAAASTSETIARFDVSDDTNSYLRIWNATSVNSSYAPSIEGKNSGTEVGLSVIGNGTTDTGTSPVTIFDSRISSTAVVTRPLFHWNNNGTTKMAMLVNGNLGIGTNAPTVALDVTGSARFRGVSNPVLTNVALYITSDGTLSTNSSDERLKTNVTTLTSSLETINQLRGVTYNWIEDPTGGLNIGFIAQEVANIVPELTFVNKNTEEQYMGVHYANVTALLVEAVKELTAENATLKSDIQAIKTHLGL